MDARGFNTLLGRLEAEGRLLSEGGRVRLAGHEPRFTEREAAIAATLEAGLRRDPFNAPFFPDLCAEAGLDAKAALDVWEALIDNGVVVRITADVFLHREAVAQAIERVRAYCRENGSITAAQFRDMVGTSRKYAVPLMEYLDAQRVTRRRGDLRELF
jgi:selenocysteine-specific elongation factor